MKKKCSVVKLGKTLGVSMETSSGTVVIFEGKDGLEIDEDVSKHPSRYQETGDEVEVSDTFFRAVASNNSRELRREWPRVNQKLENL